MSNYHSPAFLDVGQGMRRRKKDKNGTRERHQSEVKCPKQNKDYLLEHLRKDRLQQHEGAEVRLEI